MIAALVAMLLQLPATGDSTVRGTVVDGATGRPVASVSVRAPRGAAITNESGHFVVRALVGDTLRVRRIGYEPRVVAITSDSLRIALRATAIDVEPVRIIGTARQGRLGATASTEAARAQGATQAADVVARLPFVSARSGSAGAAFSMRGSRPEQVLVLLDGLPLNDPATGTADLTDVPLAALSAVTAAPGADAATWGSGATGGVLLLSPGDESTVSVSAESFGARSAEGAASGALGSLRLRAGGAIASARHDFPFVVDRSRQGLPDSTATRDDADEHHAALFASALAPSAQLWAFASRIERGLARPVGANVARLREERRRGVARGQGTLAGVTIGAAARALDVDYRDPAGVVSGSSARVASLDLDALRAVGPLVLRGGAGVDRMRATRIDATDRPRGFLAAGAGRALAGARVDAAVRADAVRGAGVHLSPSLAIERALMVRGARLSPFARVGQGFRAPTFYDLYFASQVALEPRPVRAERVVLDAEAGMRLDVGPLRASGSAFVRHTRDAIVWLPGSFSWSPDNVPDERVVGAEGHASLGDAASALSADAWAGAYRARATIDGLAVPTPYAPLAAGGASLRAARGPVALDAHVTAQGRRPYQVAPISRATQLPGVALLDLTASAAGTIGSAHVLVAAGVRNAADVRWEPVRRFPAQGRSWLLTTTLTF